MSRLVPKQAPKLVQRRFQPRAGAGTLLTWLTAAAQGSSGQERGMGFPFLNDLGGQKRTASDV